MFSRLALPVVYALAMIALAGGLASCSSTTETKQSTAQTGSFTGTWTTPRGSQLHFVAEVKNHTISIVWYPDNTTSGLYWQGTFVKASDGTLISVGDKTALAASLFGSSEDAKEFTDEDNTIGFSFSALGVTKRITLYKK